MVELISINNGKFVEQYTTGLDMIKQYLIDRDIDTRCHHYFYDLQSRYNKIDYENYVAEIADLPLFIKVIENYRRYEHNLIKDINELTDYQIKIVEDIYKHADKLKVDNNSIVGFQISYVSFLYCTIYALLLKRKYPQIRIVFGGYHIIFSQNVRNFVLRLKIADYIVNGDGCEPMYLLAKGNNVSPKLLSQFPLDVAYPMYNRVETYLTKKVVSAITSWGCPFNCHFCASHRPYVLLDLNKFRRYVHYLNDIGVERINFVDDNINPTKERILEICNLMKQFPNICLTAFACPKNIDDEIADAMKDAGFISVYLGTETFSANILNLVNKKSNQEIVENAITQLAKRNIQVDLGIICGMPGETLDDFNLTFDRIKYFRDTYGQVIAPRTTCFKIYPGSRTYTHPNEFGIKFTNWGFEYVERLPEVAYLLDWLPKTFTVEGITPEESRRRATLLTETFEVVEEEPSRERYNIS